MHNSKPQTKGWQYFRTKKAILLMALWTTIASLFSAPLAQAAADYLPGIQRTAFVKLFEWGWNDIANECKYFLGPKGYSAVEISPPQESVDRPEWWSRYQPISYEIKGRSGTEAEFRNMVGTCQNAGVDIYVDMVVNHMAEPKWLPGYDRANANPNLTYPKVPYDKSDFHFLATTPPSRCIINPQDYSNDRWRVMNCWLDYLPDLDTGKDSVRNKVANYFKKLLDMGVAGFRIDAAKHIHEDDIAAILDKVRAGYPTGDKRRNFFVTQEVISDGVSPRGNYFKNGTVNEFNYVYAMRNSFDRVGGSVGSLRNVLLPTATNNPWNFIPSENATVFVTNWDYSRKYNIYSPEGLTAYFGAKYRLAHAFMLAWPYGYPMVMSDYYFNYDHDAGPPVFRLYDPVTNITPLCFPDNPPTTTPLTWDCNHRSRLVSNMVGFRNWTAINSSVDNWVSDSADHAAFSRGNRGFIAINNDSIPWTKGFNTGLPTGDYCDIMTGERKPDGTCSGNIVRVDVSSNAMLSIKRSDAIALHLGQKANDVYVSFTVRAPTAPGENVYIAGNQSNIGNWDPNKAQACSTTAASYPNWICTIPLPTNQSVQFKFIKRNGGSVTWEADPNRTYSTPALANPRQDRNEGTWH